MFTYPVHWESVGKYSLFALYIRMNKPFAAPISNFSQSPGAFLGFIESGISGCPFPLLFFCVASRSFARILRTRRDLSLLLPSTSAVGPILSRCFLTFSVNADRAITIDGRLSLNTRPPSIKKLSPPPCYFCGFPKSVPLSEQFFRFSFHSANPRSFESLIHRP